MSLVPLLLRAIMRADGDALVMRIGEKPYVVARSGNLELATLALSEDALNGILAQLLPADAKRTLDADGAASFELPADAEFGDERFIVTATRRGGGTQVEIRRRPTIDDGVGEWPSSEEAAHVLDADDDLNLPDEAHLFPDRAPYVEIGALDSSIIDAAPAPASAENDRTPPRLVSDRAAVVVPMPRSTARSQPADASQARSTLERLLRLARDRRASAVYLASGEPPSLRIDSELHALDDEPPLTAEQISECSLVMAAGRDVGEMRVRCRRFEDHRGPGAVLRLMADRPASADQLGLSKEIQALTIEPQGLVLVTGPRGSGKSAVIAALVDLVNHTRRDHVITIEREVDVIHPHGNSFISQREVPGGEDDVLSAAQAAMREDPDVLVLEQIRTPGLMNLALDAASTGHLVIAGFSAGTAAEAIHQVLKLYAPEHSRQVQVALAEDLLGVVAQAIVRNEDGGRVMTREVLLNRAPVRSVIAEGKFAEILSFVEHEDAEKSPQAYRSTNGSI